MQTCSREHTPTPTGDRCHARCRILPMVVLLALLSPTLSAQWSTDAAANLAIADRAGDQANPKIGVTSDGGAYIGWFDNASGNYDVYLQRLDPSGVELFPHNGILVSGNPQNSFIVDWDLMVDSADHCVLVFSDDRNGGGDFDVYAYRIAPDGSFVWGANGVTLSEDPGFEPAPRVAELTNGDFVFAWTRDTAGKIITQVVTATGAVQYPAGGLQAGGLPGETPGFNDVVASDSGSYIISWVRDISTFLSPRHVHVMKYNAAGDPLWGANHVAVYDAGSIPIAHQPLLESDNAGGAILSWHASPTTFNCYAQHIDSAGAELFPHNGVTVSNDTTRLHLAPTLVYNSVTQEIFVFFGETNLSQSQWGIYGQKFDALGSRQWGAAGLQLLPVDASFNNGAQAILSDDGAMVFVTEQIGGAAGPDQMLGLRVDGSGSAVWAGQPRNVSSASSGKGDQEVVATPDGGALVVWEDDRDDFSNAYAQRINADGSLGANTATPSFLRGDINNDGAVGALLDSLFLLNWGFANGPTPPCFVAADVNGDLQVVALTDALYMLQFGFGGGPPPPSPYPSCGTDLAALTALGCDSISCP